MKRNNIDFCRTLRKNQTDAELKLWYKLRNRQLLGVKFRRQFPIENYILDFYSPDIKLAIELDGGQHFSDDNVISKDVKRTVELEKNGIKVLRFTNTDILKNIDSVCEAIIQNLNPSP